MRISDWSSDVCSSDLRRKAVGRARCVRHDRVLGGQLFMVDAEHDGEIDALGRGRDEDALGTRAQMLARAFAIGEEAGAFERDIDPIGGKIGRASWRERVCQYV